MPVQTVSKPIDALATTTLEKVKPTLADNIFKGNAVLAKLYDKREIIDGGLFLACPVMYDQNNAGKWMASGYDILTTTAQEGLTWAQFPWREFGITTVISGSEKRKNSGESAKLSLIKSKLKQTAKTMRETVSKEVCQINTAKDPLSLLGLDDIVANVASFSDTLGGIPSASNPWWQNQILGTGATGLGTSVAKFLARLYMLCTEGTEKPDLIPAEKSVYAHIEGVMAGQIRITSKEYDDLGFDNIMYKNAPIVPEFYIQPDTAAGGSLYMLNSNWLTLYVLKGADMTDNGGEFLEIVNQDAIVSKMVWEGQLGVNNRRFHGTNTGAITSVLTTWA